MPYAVVITNDDGIDAGGIANLVSNLKNVPGVQVYVVAPEDEWSAKGHAITIREPLYAQQVDRFEVPAWRITGSPADCIKLALNSLVPEPVDMVLAGINHGPNLATDVLYSGTVSAAIESALGGVPAVALSLAGRDGNCQHFSTAGYFAEKLIPDLLTTQEQMDVLNVNVPDIPLDLVAGVKVTDLGSCPYDDIVEVERDENGDLCYWLTVRTVEDAASDGTDLKAVANNFISLTPLEFFEITDCASVQSLKPLAEKMQKHLPLENPD